MGELLMATKCNSCGGTYNSIQADGSRYFHACADIPNPAYNADPTKPPLDLRQTIARPNKRDENITGFDPATGTVTIVSEGLGVTVI
jgi:ssDNA-binding Zn-finger/Zn-ribbon topoisomerase 1